MSWTGALFRHHCSLETSPFVRFAFVILIGLDLLGGAKPQRNAPKGDETVGIVFQALAVISTAAANGHANRSHRRGCSFKNFQLLVVTFGECSFSAKHEQAIRLRMPRKLPKIGF